MQKKKILFLVNEDWYFVSHRLGLAKACINCGWDVSVATPLGDHKSEIELSGVRLFPVRMKRGNFSIRQIADDLRTIVGLAILVRRFKPDVLHLVGLKMVILGGVASLFFSSALTVNAITGMGHLFTSTQLKARVGRKIAEILLVFFLKTENSILVIQNQEDADQLIQSRIVKKERVAVIPGSGVDTIKFKPRPEPLGSVVVTFVGRMLKEKGVQELVEASRLLKARGVGLHIRLVGKPDPGNPSSLTVEDLNRWHSEGLIIWEGYKQDIERIWGESHIAVLPSYREGMPLSLLEAAASGRPLIATDVPGCRELVEHNANGLLVVPQDPLDLANAIETLVLSSDLRSKMGRAAREKVETVFDQESINSAFLSVYQKAVSG